jgi:hypothetical protein
LQTDLLLIQARIASIQQHTKDAYTFLDQLLQKVKAAGSGSDLSVCLKELKAYKTEGGAPGTKEAFKKVEDMLTLAIEEI